MTLGVVEPVADGEPVRDLEADVADGQVDAPALGLGEQRADLERGRVAGPQVAQQVVEGEPGVDDVLDEEDVAALDRGVGVLEDPTDTRGIGGRAIARDRHEVDLARDRQLPHQVGHEQHRALEDADHQQVAAVVVAADVGPQLADSSLKVLGADQGLADSAAGHSSVRQVRTATWRVDAASRKSSETATPATQATRPRATTTGTSRRAERGTPLSVNRS